jgi:hypothetical protein
VCVCVCVVCVCVCVCVCVIVLVCASVRACAHADLRCFFVDSICARHAYMNVRGCFFCVSCAVRCK